MIRVLFAIAALSAAAAPPGPGKSWPSLAHRPVEDAVPNAATGSPSGETGAAASAAPGPAASDAVAVLATIERDVASLEARLADQRAATARAAAAAAGSADGSDASAGMQLERGRLDRLLGQAAALREQLGVVAGDLAVAAHHGSDVSTSLRAAGALLERVMLLTADDAVSPAVRSRPPVPRRPRRP